MNDDGHDVIKEMDNGSVVMKNLYEVIVIPQILPPHMMVGEQGLKTPPFPPKVQGN